jgi:cytochrome c-type biogenesis protein
MEPPSLFVAFAAGLLSFLSPCVFPLVPAYIGYLSGSVVVSARSGATSGGTVAISTATARWIAITHSLAFVLGFTVIFVVVFGSLAGALSELLRAHRAIIQQIMGIIVIIFGLNTIGIIRLQFLDYTRRLELHPSRNLGYARSFLIGTAFAIGWTPCIGYWLGIIISLAMNGQPDRAFLPFLAYSIGLGIPFLVAGMAMGQISSGLKRLTRRMYSFKLGNWTVIDQVNIVSLVSGIILIVMGLLIATNSMAFLAQFGPTIDLAP